MLLLHVLFAVAEVNILLLSCYLHRHLRSLCSLGTSAIELKLQYSVQNGLNSQSITFIDNNNNNK